MKKGGLTRRGPERLTNLSAHRLADHRAAGQRASGNSGSVRGTELSVFRVVKDNVASPVRTQGNSAKSPLCRNVRGSIPLVRARARIGRPPQGNAPGYAYPPLVVRTSLATS